MELRADNRLASTLHAIHSRSAESGAPRSALLCNFPVALCPFGGVTSLHKGGGSGVQEQRLCRRCVDEEADSVVSALSTWTPITVSGVAVTAIASAAAVKQRANEPVLARRSES